MSKKNLNENVDLLNKEDVVSETPATLVTPSPDKEYEKGSQHGSKLSPNPAGFGFTSQREVDTLPESGEYNVIYIVPIKNNGGIIGYKKWKWDLETKTFKRVYGSIPDLKLVDGGRNTPAIVSNTPKKKPRVFNEDVSIIGTLRVNGKIVETRDPTTEEDTPRVWKTNASFGQDIGDIDFTQVKPGDIIFSVADDTSGLVSALTVLADLTINVVQTNKYYRYRTTTGDFIASGDTVVAEGGTKLYKHTITITNGSGILKSKYEVSGPPITTINLISIESDKITTVKNTAGVYGFDKYLTCVSVSAVKGYFVFNANDYGMTILKAIDMTNSLIENIFEGAGNVSDTVTEL